MAPWAGGGCFSWLASYFWRLGSTLKSSGWYGESRKKTLLFTTTKGACAEMSGCLHFCKHAPYPQPKNCSQALFLQFQDLPIGDRLLAISVSLTAVPNRECHRRAASGFQGCVAIGT